MNMFLISAVRRAALVTSLAIFALLSGCGTGSPPAPSPEPPASQSSMNADRSPSGRTRGPTAVLNQIPAVPAQGPQPTAPSTRVVREAADFNGDGYTDL